MRRVVPPSRSNKIYSNKPHPSRVLMADVTAQFTSHFMTTMRPAGSIQQSLMDYLRQNSGRTVTRTELQIRVWGFRMDPRTRVIDQTVSLVRKGLAEGERIATVHGLGYQHCRVLA